MSSTTCYCSSHLMQTTFIHLVTTCLSLLPSSSFFPIVRSSKHLICPSPQPVISSQARPAQGWGNTERGSIFVFLEIFRNEAFREGFSISNLESSKMRVWLFSPPIASRGEVFRIILAKSFRKISKNAKRAPPPSPSMKGFTPDAISLQ